MNSIIIPFFVLAYLGKGQAFFGLIPHGAKWASAAIVGLLMAGLYGLEWFLPFGLLWWLFVAPDIGTGFASIHGDGNIWEKDISQKRDWCEWPLKQLDRLCSRIADVKLAGLAWMTGRQFIYLLPFTLLHLFLGGWAWLLSGSLLLGSLYYLGGWIVRVTQRGEAVFIAEVLTGLLIGGLL